LLKGYREVRFPIALASRKGQLDDLDKFAKVIFGERVGEFITGTVVNIANKLKGAKVGSKRPFNFLNYGVGVMRVADKYWAVPKVMVTTDNGIGVPKNHRDIISARALYEKYHKFRSFAYPYTGQKKIYKNITIPFSLADYVKLQTNSYFTTIDGKTGKFERIEWALGKDMAVVDFIIYEPYIKNLVESTFEV